MGERVQSYSSASKVLYLWTWTSDGYKTSLLTNISPQETRRKKQSVLSARDQFYKHTVMQTPLYQHQIYMFVNFGLNVVFFCTKEIMDGFKIPHFLHCCIVDRGDVSEPEKGCG